VNLASGHINIGRNAAPQIQQCVQFHRALVAAEFSPGEKRQAQIDGRGVQGIHRLGQLHSERLVAVEVASGGNQNLSEIGVDPPVAVLVGVGQRVARNLSPETHMIELGLLSAKTSFDIAEAFAIGELSKSQTEELIPAGEIFDVAIALGSARRKFETGRLRGSPRVEKKRFGLGSSAASGASWKAVGWRQKRSKQL